MTNFFFYFILCKYIIIIIYNVLYDINKCSVHFRVKPEGEDNHCSFFFFDPWSLSQRSSRRRRFFFSAVPAGEQLGVRWLAQGSHLSPGIEGGENAHYSPLPPLTIPAGAEIPTHDLVLQVQHSIH